MAHWPFAQVAVAFATVVVHVWPQLPQLLRLLCGLTHVPLHRVGCVAGGTRFPLRLIWPPLQWFPHWPQLLASVWVLTQTPWQAFWPVGQTQAPLTQLAP